LAREIDVELRAQLGDRIARDLRLAQKGAI